MPVEGKRKLAAAGNALDGELAPLLEWMRALDAGLGRSAETAASKMRYQMNRLRRLAANFQLQSEDSLKRHADAMMRALYPGGVLQERVHGAAYYFARYGFELAERLTTQAWRAVRDTWLSGCEGQGSERQWSGIVVSDQWKAAEGTLHTSCELEKQLRSCRELAKQRIEKSQKRDQLREKFEKLSRLGKSKSDSGYFGGDVAPL